MVFDLHLIHKLLRYDATLANYVVKTTEIFSVLY